jgi:hypothetical protein
MKLQLLVIACVAAVAVATDGSDNPCYLLGGATAGKPFPSLTQCYKQNQQACCVSAHDQTIQNAYSSILSGTCIREYPALEQYYCLGCSPFADSFIRYYNATTGTDPVEYLPAFATEDWDTMPSGIGTKKGDYYENPKASTEFETVEGKMGEIKLCASFAEQLLYDPEPTGTNVIDAYDGCGMMLDGISQSRVLSDDDAFIGDGDGILSRVYFALDDSEIETGSGATAIGKAPKDANLIDPGDGGFNNKLTQSPNLRISPEWKFFQTMRPPYFSSFDFEISWYHDVGSSDNPDCFGAASSVQVASMAVVVVAAVAQMLA